MVDPAPAAADLALLEERVAEASLAAAGRDEEEFGVFLRGPRAEPLGGVSGLVLGRCCELEALWVDESLRGQGLARALIGAAEAEAASRGCTLVMLHAYDALVPRLYERLGYRTVGLIEDCLAGRAVRWLTKDLRGGPRPDSEAPEAAVAAAPGGRSGAGARAPDPAPVGSGTPHQPDLSGRLGPPRAT